jgi:hypothetical protein
MPAFFVALVSLGNPSCRELIRPNFSRSSFCRTAVTSLSQSIDLFPRLKWRVVLADEDSTCPR